MGDRVKLILMVCSGNVCRSPMAEGLLKEELRRRNLEGIRVVSAGVVAYHGLPAVEMAALVCKNEDDLDITGHRSRALSVDMVEGADMVLVMQRHQGEDIRGTLSRARGKIRLLGSFAADDRGDAEIPDPAGPSYQEFHRCYKRIRRAVLALADSLEKGSGAEGSTK